MWEEVDSDLSQAFLQGQDKCLTLNMAHAQVAQRLVSNTSLRTPVSGLQSHFNQDLLLVVMFLISMLIKEVATVSALMSSSFV